MSDVTRILSAIDSGDPHAAAELLPLVYDELRRLATARLRAEPTGHTLQPTALVHEAYLRLVGGRLSDRWDGRGHFFAAAAEAMRRILIEHARHKDSRKAGGGRRRLDLTEVVPADPEPDLDLLALDEALGRLADEEPAVAEVVKLRYFAGLTVKQTADSLGISVRTANRHWAYARAWLYQQLSQQGEVDT
jgi:RNA polymerase sigma factor (TIGR02999 family)